MKYEEYLLSLVTLGEKDIVVEQIQSFKLRDHVDQEILWFVAEESDTFNDLTMSRLHHICSQTRRQLLEECLPVSIITDRVCLILKEALDLSLSGHWQIVFL